MYPVRTARAGESDARFYGDAQQQRQCVDNQAVDRSDERHAQTAREPVSYTHLDVYKRQVNIPILTYTSMERRRNVSAAT